MSNVTTAAAAAASAISSSFAAAVAALTPTQIGAFVTSLSGETTAEKNALKLLNLYVVNMQNNNPAGEATIQASIFTVGTLPNWFIDDLPNVWNASTPKEAQTAINAIR